MKMAIKVNGKIVAGRGADGKSAYQAAVDAGYVGTETDFNEALSKIDEVPTDAYTKAEADQKFATQASVTSVSSKVDNVQTVVNQQQEMIVTLSDDVTSATQKVSELETDVTQMQEQLADLATKTELEAVKSTAESAQSAAQTASTAASSANSTATAAKNTADNAQSTASSAQSKANTNANEIDDIDEIINRISGNARACWCSVGNLRSGATTFTGGCWLPNKSVGGTVFSTVIGHLRVQSGDTVQVGCNVPGFFTGITGAALYGLDGTKLSGSSQVTNGGKGININITSNGLANPRGVVIAYTAPTI